MATFEDSEIGKENPFESEMTGKESVCLKECSDRKVNRDCPHNIQAMDRKPHGMNWCQTQGRQHSDYWKTLLKN